eukprot:gene1691-450_t
MAQEPAKSPSPDPKGAGKKVRRAGLKAPGKRPEGWVAPGPRPWADVGAADPRLQPEQDEDLCYLVGDFRVLQKVMGNRWSVDDLMTAWMATRVWGHTPPGSHLDIGCGIGSVLQMMAWAYPECPHTGIEAQEVSFGLAERNILYNQGPDCSTVRAVYGDIRDPSALPTGATFDLITGTPPYFPHSDGVASKKVQKGPCSFESRGGVEVYLEAAQRWLAPDGLFVMCHTAVQKSHLRVLAKAKQVGLAVCDAMELCQVALGPCGRTPHTAPHTPTMKAHYMGLLSLTGVKLCYVHGGPSPYEDWIASILGR